VVFFDEARFGTHTKIGYGWFKKGERPPIKVKIGYQSLYVYSAINYEDGSNFSIMLPRVDTILLQGLLIIIDTSAYACLNAFSSL
jgi:hypothetical protein